MSRVLATIAALILTHILTCKIRVRLWKPCSENVAIMHVYIEFLSLVIMFVLVSCFARFLHGVRVCELACMVSGSFYRIARVLTESSALQYSD